MNKGAYERMKETMTLQHDGELSIYLPQQASKGVVLICPGGGYSWLSPREGEPVARRFGEAGWTAAVLTYTCFTGQPLEDLPLRQAGEALAVLRARFDGQRIVVCGFSAGGHLAASLGVHWRDAGLSRPDGMILCYPVITAGKYAHQGSIANLAGEGDSAYWSLENHVSEDTPPAFIWHTVTDPTVPVENSLLLMERMAAYHIPVEMHLYPQGTHGLSLATKEVEEPEKQRFADPHVAGWFDLCISWLDTLL